MYPFSLDWPYATEGRQTFCDAAEDETVPGPIFNFVPAKSRTIDTYVFLGESARKFVP